MMTSISQMVVSRRRWALGTLILTVKLHTCPGSGRNVFANLSHPQGARATSAPLASGCHCKGSHWRLKEFPTVREPPARGWAAGDGGAGSHRIQAWGKVRSWEGAVGGSFCLDGKLSENPELWFQFRLAYWFVLF